MEALSEYRRNKRHPPPQTVVCNCFVIKVICAKSGLLVVALKAAIYIFFDFKMTLSAGLVSDCLTLVAQHPLATIRLSSSFAWLVSHASFANVVVGLFGVSAIQVTQLASYSPASGVNLACKALLKGETCSHERVSWKVSKVL